MTWAESVGCPVFLVGAERSGTTLLRLMLDCHPKISFHFEFEFAVDLVSDSGQFPSLRRYHGYLQANRVFRLSAARIDPCLNYPQLVNSFLVQKQRRDGKPIVGAVVHRHFDRLLYLWPDARFIHLVRDGRDVARSVIRKGWAGNVWTGSCQWLEAERLWQRMKGKLPVGRYLEVRYESLIRNPEAALRDISNFVRVPYDPTMLTYHLHSTFTPPDPGRVGQWRCKLSNLEIRLVEARIGGMLADRGYELSGLEAPHIGRLMRWQLRLQDCWARMKFRQDRYGLGLWLADVVSRRLGRKSWRRRVRLQLDQIDMAHLA